MSFLQTLAIPTRSFPNVQPTAVTSIKVARFYVKVVMTSSITKIVMVKVFWTNLSCNKTI